MTAAAPITKAPEALEREATALVVQAKALRITDHASHEAAGAFLRDVKALRQEVAATFDPIVERAHQTHREALAQRRRHDEPLVEAERVVKAAIGAYAAEQERRARIAAAEAAAKARREEEERRLAEAAALEAAGEREEAERVLEEPVYAPPPPPVAVQRVSGVSTREKWSAKIVDKMALVRAVADGKASPELLDVNMATANRLAAALKETLAIPGLRSVSDRVVSARASCSPS